MPASLLEQTKAPLLIRPPYGTTVAPSTKAVSP
jgi:hypothetical protein